jgi:hypothetical protein
MLKFIQPWCEGCKCGQRGNLVDFHKYKRNRVRLNCVLDRGCEQKVLKKGVRGCADSSSRMLVDRDWYLRRTNFVATLHGLRKLVDVSFILHDHHLHFQVSSSLMARSVCYVVRCHCSAIGAFESERAEAASPSRDRFVYTETPAWALEHLLQRRRVISRAVYHSFGVEGRDCAGQKTIHITRVRPSNGFSASSRLLVPAWRKHSSQSVGANLRLIEGLFSNQSRCVYDNISFEHQGNVGAFFWRARRARRNTSRRALLALRKLSVAEHWTPDLARDRAGWLGISIGVTYAETTICW